MAAWPVLHARVHTPQGYLAGWGPGLVFRSPESRIRKQSQDVVELSLVRRARVLIRGILDLVEKGVGGVPAAS